MAAPTVLNFDGLEVQPNIKTSHTRRDAKKGRGEKRKRSEMTAKLQKYTRGDKVVIKGVQDKKLRRVLKTNEKNVATAVEQAARSEILMPSEPGFIEAEGELDRTWRFKQEAIKANVDLRTQAKMFDLKLPTFGPYNCDYTRNGRYLLLGGRKGHIAMLDSHQQRAICEFHVRETVRDVKILHDESMYAVAQKKYVYIYDKSGIELHCLRNHVEPNRLEFLPYHFLLSSVGKAGFLKYQDTSTGKIVAELRTRLGDCDVMTQNSRNAVICLGHNNGQITMWSPNMTQPLVKMLAHQAPLLSIAVDLSGQYLASSGLDGQVRIWDIRTYKNIHTYYSVRPAASLSISQRGLLAVGCGPHVQVWKDALSAKASAPYLVHEMPGRAVRDVQFCPYEDVLGVSHSLGFSSLVVPGAGEPNFDSFEANPFQTVKQRREATVHSLLEKLQPEMIALEPNVIGTVDPTAVKELRLEEKAEADRVAAATPKKEKNRMKGRNTSLKKWLRKQKNIIDKRKVQKKDEIAKSEKQREEARKQAQRDAAGVSKPALDRFARK